MIILFCFYLLSARAASVSHATGEDFSSQCTTLDNCRTLFSIIWSSLTTIGLCTWGALHPNIPLQFPDEKEQPAGYWKTKECWIGWWRIVYSFMKERVVLFIVALLVPEYMLAWAIRQNLKARDIVKEGFMREGCRVPVTQVHGFFIIMGGFHLYQNRIIESKDGEDGKKKEELGTPLHPLDEKDVRRLVNDGKINLPTADEIQDRSKSDWLGKTLVIFQTLWFVIQCSARGIEHLPVTELEIVALAYTTINLGIYIAWWDKPRCVYHPNRVISSIVAEEGENVVPETEPPVSLEAGREDDDGERLIDGDNHPRKTPKSQLSWKKPLGLLEPAFKYMFGMQDDNVDLKRLDAVPTFWAGTVNGSTGRRMVMISDSLALLVGIVFGAIHCIAWSSPFPSHRALLMWRLSAAAIAGIPVLILATLALGSMWMERDDDENVIGWIIVSSVILLAILSILVAPLYIVARGTTLVLAFTTLKDLPAGAYQTVQWTHLIPHI